MTLPTATETSACGGFLHDTIEDTEATHDDIRTLFGRKVHSLVDELTNKYKAEGSSMNRAERKKFECERLSRCSREAKIIKLIDRIDNLLEMDGAELPFLEKYCNESVELSKAIGDAHAELNEELCTVIHDRLHGIGAQSLIS
jgi:(p)ppGpp synthase/HD superfamily hydrolase